MGGQGDESWARSVYGDMGQQKAGQGNVIAMNPNPQRGGNAPGAVVVPTVGGGAAVVPTMPMNGGEHPQGMKLGGNADKNMSYGGADEEIPEQIGGEEPPMIVENGGGGIITDVAVPAVLLYARDSIRKRRFVGMPNMSVRNSGNRRKFRRGSRKFRRGSRKGRR